ncbi:2-C-methyl-D-erythritol 4-phosphate cytidylyltransferase [Candidatus Latescibacterota bacterium]
MSAWAVIVAGGCGKRMGSEIPKQLLKIGGITIIERTLKPFGKCLDIEGIVIVASESCIEYIKTVCNVPKIIYLVSGGAQRQDSVWNGLCAVPEKAEIVVIHDAVRPFINSELISTCVRSAMEHGAVSVMRPLKETVKAVENDIVVHTPDRSSLWITLTPQSFKRELILKAHKHAQEDCFAGTDDSMLVERIGYPVHIIEGDDMNIKITTPVDLEIARTLVKLYEKKGG